MTFPIFRQIQLYSIEVGATLWIPGAFLPNDNAKLPNDVCSSLFLVLSSSDVWDVLQGELPGTPMLTFTSRSTVNLPNISPEGLKPLVRDALFVAEQASPIVTGRLRTGWYATERSLRNDVPYSGFVDAGTRHMEPRGMSRKTVEWMLENFESYVLK